MEQQHNHPLLTVCLDKDNDSDARPAPVVSLIAFLLRHAHTRTAQATTSYSRTFQGSGLALCADDCCNSTQGNARA